MFRERAGKGKPTVSLKTMKKIQIMEVAKGTKKKKFANTQRKHSIDKKGRYPKSRGGVGEWEKQHKKRGEKTKS